MNISTFDNFYTNPQEVIKLIGEFSSVGCGTGKRSRPLMDIDQNFYYSFCHSIFRLYGLNPNSVFVHTYFMEHEPHQINILNNRWVHIDGKNPELCMMTMEEYKLILCGQIFLSKHDDPDSGVKFYDLKSSVNWSEKELIDNCIINYTLPRSKYESGLITLEEYEKMYCDYHNNFELTAEIKNKYNRMVSWKAGSLHGDPITTKSRLSQYFFVERL